MNNTMVREIRGAKINPKSPLKIRVRKIRGGANYASKYGIYHDATAPSGSGSHYRGFTITFCQIHHDR